MTRIPSGRAAFWVLLACSLGAFLLSATRTWPRALPASLAAWPFDSSSPLHAPTVRIPVRRVAVDRTNPHPAARRPRWDVQALADEQGKRAIHSQAPVAGASRRLLADSPNGSLFQLANETANNSTTDASSSSSSSSTGTALVPAPGANGTSGSSPSSSWGPGHVHLIDYSDFMYIGMVGIGTPSQYFGCVFDSGSADLWVFTQTQDATAQQPWIHYFNESASSTHRNLTNDRGKLLPEGKPGGWSIRYGTGDASGAVALDTLTLGGLAINDQAMAFVTHTDSDAFSHPNEPIDGIFGLAFEKLGTNRRMAVMPRADQGKPAVFSFHMTSSSSDPEPQAPGQDEQDIIAQDDATHPQSWFQLGPRNESLAPHGFTDADALDPEAAGVNGRWVIEIDSMSIDHTEVSSLCSVSSGASVRCLAWVDTGSSFILMPPSRYAEVMASVVAQRPDCTVTDCPSPAVEGRVTCGALLGYNFLPTLSIRLSGRDFTLTPEQYVLLDRDTAEDGTVTDFLRIGFGCGPHGVSGLDLWILGDTFLKNYYTVFDMPRLVVSFANAEGLVITWRIALAIAGATVGAMAIIFACLYGWYLAPLRSAVHSSSVSGVDSQSQQPVRPSAVDAILNRAHGRGSGYAQVTAQSGEPAAHDEADSNEPEVDIEMATPANNNRAETAKAPTHQFREETLEMDDDDLVDL